MPSAAIQKYVAVAILIVSIIIAIRQFIKSNNDNPKKNQSNRQNQPTMEKNSNNIDVNHERNDPFDENNISQAPTSPSQSTSAAPKGDYMITTAYHTAQESQQQWADAIEKIIEQISLQKNILRVEDAIESLILTGGQYAQPHVHALYLQKVPESDGFTRKDVSIYLAELGEDNELLNTYFQLVHFGGLSIENSLRLFYTQLKLEALMNKNLLNVLLTALAQAYKTNGGNFNGDIQDAIRIYNAMIMLNDSLHNQNALGRARQTEKSFLQIINDKNENNVFQFDEDEMRRVYNSIQQMSLQSTKQSMHTMQRSQPITTKEMENTKPKSYSKYGTSKSNGRSDIIDDPKYTSIMRKNYGDDDINPTQNSGSSCCIVM